MRVVPKVLHNVLCLQNGVYNLHAINVSVKGEVLGQLHTYRKICKNGREMRKIKSVWWGISCHFFRVLRPFFRFSHFAPGLVFTQKLKGFRGLFIRHINKKRNLPKMLKMCSECFAFRGVFREMRNTKSVYSQSYKQNV